MKTSSLLLALLPAALGCLDLDSLVRGSPDLASPDLVQQDLLGSRCRDRCQDPTCQDSLACVSGLVAHGVLADPVCAVGDMAQGPAFFQGLTDLRTCSKCVCTVECQGSVALHEGGGANCSGNARDQPAISGNLCVPVAAGITSLRLTLTGATCQYSGPVVRPDVDFQARRRLCLPQGAAPCETLSCVRQLAGAARSCVALEGEGKQCPAPLVAAGTWYRDTTDPRTCLCCQLIGGPTQCARLARSTMQDCSNDAGGSVDPGICGTTAGVAAVKLAPRPDAICGSSVFGVGSPALASPLTLCCTS